MAELSTSSHRPRCRWLTTWVAAGSCETCSLPLNPNKQILIAPLRFGARSSMT